MTPRAVGEVGMTEEQLEAIRERAEKASGGPWETGIYAPSRKFLSTPRHECVRYGAGHPWTGQVVCSTGPQGNELSQCDAAFIAHARTDVPALLAHIQQLRAALAASEEERERLAAERDALLEAVGRAVFPNLQDDGRKVYPWVKTALAEIADIGADVARLNWLEAAPKAVAHVQFGCALSAEITTLRAAIDFASSVSSSPPAGR